MTRNQAAKAIEAKLASLYGVKAFTWRPDPEEESSGYVVRVTTATGTDQLRLSFGELNRYEKHRPRIERQLDARHSALQAEKRRPKPLPVDTSWVV